MCKYKGISPTCSDVTDRRDDITDKEKATLVDKHNEYIRKIATVRSTGSFLSCFNNRL